jgi:hypothetical protein
MPFSIFKFSFKVPKATGILVPYNFRQLNNSLWIWKPYISLEKRTSESKFNSRNNLVQANFQMTVNYNPHQMSISIH